MRPPLPLAATTLLGALMIPAPRPAPAVPPIVFVSRRAPPGPWSGEIPGFGPHARAQVVGGRLMIRESDGRVRALLPEGALEDVSDPAVSWDARTIAFAGTPARDSAWRIYRVGIDGSGLRALTFTDRALEGREASALPPLLARYDDLDPCWIGPRRLVFASTRWPLISEYGGVPVTNLFALDLGKPGPRRLTTERNGAEEPAYDPVTGRIVFARWWHNRFRASDLERSGLTTAAARALPADSVNLWQLVSFDPGLHDTRLAAGDPRSRAGTMAYQPALLGGGAIVAAVARHLGLSPSAGGVGLAIFRDATRVNQARATRSGIARPGPGMAPLLPRALVAPHRLAGPAMPTGPVDPYRDAAGLAAPQACSPAVLPDGRIVFAFDPGARGDFGLFVIRPDGTGLAPLVDLPGPLELDPAPVVARAWREHGFDLDRAALEVASLPRDRPAPPGAGAPSFRFHCLNLFANAPLDAPLPDAPPPTPNLRIRFFALLARPESVFGDTAILWREAMVSRRGEVDVPGLPVDVPMFEQIVDARGRVLMSAHGPSHVAGFNASAPGERRCIGCHVGHSALPVPASVEAAREFNAAPAARVTSSPARRGGAGARAAVDRRLRGRAASTSWIAADRAHAWIRLEWKTPLELGALVIHGLRNAATENAEVRIERAGRIVTTRALEIAGGTEGMRYDLPFTPADAVEVRLEPAVGAPAQDRNARAGSKAAAERAALGVSEIEALARLP